LLGDLGFSVAASTAAYEYDDLEEELLENADVSILTPERLDLLLRINRSALEKIRLVVVDEGHILEAEGRGIKTELLLTRLRRLLPDARFLVASAIVGEASLDEISRWLAAKTAGAQRDTAVSSWRPSLQQVARFEWATPQTGFIRFLTPDITEGEVSTFLPGVIKRREIKFINERTQKRNTRKWPMDKADIAAELALRLSRLGPVLVYVSQPKWTMSVASKIDELVSIDPSMRPDWWGNTGDGTGRAEQIASDWLANERLQSLLEKGVAVHHGDLPEALKEAIEKDAREGRFKIIVATGTLSSGVNIPIRTVVFHSYHRFDEVHDRPVLMPPADYWNIAGRAGRAGYESEGLVVHIADNEKDREALDKYMDFPKEGVALRSQLLRLGEQVERQMVSHSIAGDALDPEILALAAEEVTLDDAEHQIDLIVGDSLAASQER
jgi:helicase